MVVAVVMVVLVVVVVSEWLKAVVVEAKVVIEAEAEIGCES